MRRPITVVALATMLATGIPSGGQGAFTGAATNGPNSILAGGWKSHTWTMNNDGIPTNWWPMNDAWGAIDAAPARGSLVGRYLNGHETVYGAIAPNTSTAAARFDAELGWCMSLADNFDFAGRSPFSLELWFYRKSDTHSARLISKNWQTNDPAAGWEIGIHGHGEAADVRDTVYFARYGDGGADYVGTGTPAALNTWYHVVATYDGTTMSFFLNGENTGSTTSTRQILDTTHRAYVGCAGQDFGSGVNWISHFTGAIDEVAIYSSALTPRQVRAHYFAGISGN